MRRDALLLALLAAAVLGPARAALGGGAADDPERRTPVVRAVEKAAPAVVNISTTKLVQVAVDPWFQEFYGRGPTRAARVQSVGSGVIIHPDGYLITNSHVVQRATEIVVGLGENGAERTWPGVLLAEDSDSDLALVKIEGDRPLPAVVLGRSDDLMIGEPAIAVGNPFSVGKTVTTGVISALRRTVELETGFRFEDFIQTDAAINPGNSGGPLLNIHGEMIGVNTAIRRDGEGIGFAIPVDRVKEILERLIEAAVDRANLGFRPVPGPGGVRVGSVEEAGAAAAGGLLSGDVVERVENRAVESVFDFATPILGKRPGDRILVTIRRNGERRRVDLLVPEPPLPPDVKYVAGRFGVIGRDATPGEAAEGRTGVVVASLVENGPAARVQMQPGDRIVAIERIPVGDVAALSRLLKRVRTGTTLDVEVVRGNRPMVGSVTVD